MKNTLKIVFAVIVCLICILLAYYALGYFVGGISLMFTSKWTFGHFACAIFGGGLFVLVAFFVRMPDTGSFSFFGKTDPHQRTPTTFRTYTHPLLDKTYFSHNELMDDLEKLAKNADWEISQLQQESRLHPENQYLLHRIAQFQALGEKYKNEKAERSPAYLYVMPLILGLMGFSYGFLLNDVLFHILSLWISIPLTIVGIAALGIYILLTLWYLSNL